MARVPVEIRPVIGAGLCGGVLSLLALLVQKYKYWRAFLSKSDLSSELGCAEVY